MTETDWNDHARVRGYRNKFAVGAKVVGGISYAKLITQAHEWQGGFAGRFLL